MSKPSSVVIRLSCILMCFLLLFTSAFADSFKTTTKIGGLKVHSSANKGSSTVVTLKKGREITVLSQDGDWCHISVDLGSKTVEGYVKASDIVIPEGLENATSAEAVPDPSTATNSGALADDQVVSNVMLHFASSLAKVSYNDVKNHLDSLQYSYTTVIGNDELATFSIQCEKGDLYIAFYPLWGSGFGDPMQEMLSTLEYHSGDRWITISDTMHLNSAKLSTGDRSRDPITVEVNSVNELVNFYNSVIGGSVTLDESVTVSTDSQRHADIQQFINDRMEEYSLYYDTTTINRIDVNANAGTSNADDFIVLIYLNWATRNTAKTTRKMLEMLSDDLAVAITGQYPDASEITLFWEVPYLLESGTCAKYSYEGRNGHAYLIEKFGPLYN